MPHTLHAYAHVYVHIHMHIHIHMSYVCVSEGGSRAGGEALCGFTLAAQAEEELSCERRARARALTASAAQVAASEGWYKVVPKGGCYRC